MPLLTLHKLDNYLYFDERQCREVGKSLSKAYQHASPFPHIVVDDFVDSGLLRQVHSEYPALEGRNAFNRDQERLKYQFDPHDVAGGLARNILSELNGRAFLGFLEEMTGIEGLISDPYYSGGGLHLTRAGGHLSVHADFNIHGKMGVERQLNLLIYLNHDWDPEFGGGLELWDREMKACQKRIEPLLGRAVVFNTSSTSFHGHPEPLNCPPDRDRRSIATYYYTALPSDTVRPRDTAFKVRPGTADQADWAIRIDQFISDWVPRRLQRMVLRLNPFR